MYQPINLLAINQKHFNEKFSLFNSKEFTCDHIYTESVFTGGKENIKPIEEKVKIVKDRLTELISKQDNNNKFNPKSFWRDPVFKNLEDTIRETFGFRTVNIEPYIERYNSNTKLFESKEINCMIYHSDRYPIDGLVTDKGFYDKTHSLVMDIRMSLGFINILEPSEILGCILHEFGHNIDPAIVDIKYVETNILSKYLTDRKDKITNTERRIIGNNKFIFTGCLFNNIKASFTIAVNKTKDLLNNASKQHSNLFVDLFTSHNKKIDKRIGTIRNAIKNEKEKFNRQNYSEAFADNFARMYGYGTQLASAFKKMSKNLEGEINSRFKKEKKRQDIIIYITESALKDVHKTDIHRIRSLINEYNNDIKDPNIPETVKKQMKEDVEELEKILDSYLNDFSDLQNRINKAINEELSKIEMN